MDSKWPVVKANDCWSRIYPLSSGEKTFKTVLVLMGGGKNAPSTPATWLHALPDQQENSLSFKKKKEKEKQNTSHANERIEQNTSQRTVPYVKPFQLLMDPVLDMESFPVNEVQRPRSVLFLCSHKSHQTHELSAILRLTDQLTDLKHQRKPSIRILVLGRKSSQCFHGCDDRDVISIHQELTGCERHEKLLLHPFDRIGHGVHGEHSFKCPACRGHRRSQHRLTSRGRNRGWKRVKETALTSCDVRAACLTDERQETGGNRHSRPSGG